jgi:peptidase E
MSAKGTIVLMGSGELTATMVEVHKELLARLGSDARAVFLDTPAGFQLNADQLSAKAVEYFRNKVGHPMAVAAFKSKGALSALDSEKAFLALRQADFVIVGPGSPTYAVHQWEGTPIPDILARRIEDGACLVAASAAALTVGARTLPVYEIYKVGEELRWVPGLDLLGRFGLNLVVMPHWNNAEGGTHDTRFCFMGESRFRLLEALLPEDAQVLGMDEHTACIIDFSRNEACIRGIGGVTLRRGGSEVTFKKNAVVPLDVFKGNWHTPSPHTVSAPPGGSAAASAESRPDSFWDSIHVLESGFQNAQENRNAEGMSAAILELDRIIWTSARNLESEEFISQARELLREWVALLGSSLSSGSAAADECLDPLVKELLKLRDDLRRRKRWEEADSLRDCLQRAGVIVEDTNAGARWRTN